jgi:hypothetical protein
MSETVVLERVFDVPQIFDDLQAREDAIADCFADHLVVGRCSYMALDGRSAICLYDAPDAETVRTTQRRAGLPVQHAWSATLIGAHEPPAAGSIVIVVQREFAEPISLSYLETTLRERGHCLDIHRVALRTTHLARDGCRAVCVFDAPDAESVRKANHQMEIPVQRAWPARVHLAPPR